MKLNYLKKRWGTAIALVYGMSMAGLLAVDPELIWSDEFDPTPDGLPDASKWIYDTGAGGWGNNEQQFYTEGRLENARVEGGLLIIEARQEPWPTRNPVADYTSARLLSKGQGDWTYGRVEVKAKLPAGRGTWPAIWMLPTGNEYGIWPRSGEIDIMEHVGYDMGRVHGSLHSLANNWLTGTQPTSSTMVANVDTEFHEYTIEWSPSLIRFLIDDVEFYSFSNPETGWEAWPFDQPFHLILNIAVGGWWGGAQGIDESIWPVRMEIDYIRVYNLGDTVPLDTDNDMDPNETDPDDDGDGLTDLEEHAIGTNILKVDTDGDGFSDFDEVEAGTYPLLVGSFPGSNASILMVNNDFEFGEEPWIIHTNRLNSGGGWIGQLGSWAGAYGIFDYVTDIGDGMLTFGNYARGDAPNAEHLLYQEWKPTIIDLLPGDVIRFRGEAMATSSVPNYQMEAFIRVLDNGFQPMPGTITIPIGPEMTAFELETTLGEETFNVLQSGILIKGPQAETATITFTGLETTLNEGTTWANWPEVEGNVDTGGWMGWLFVTNDPWVWSYSLSRWIFLPEDFIDESGGWVYVPGDS
ncbi:MAG: family 16 glycosylhydrolase [Puniceicoccaceae bacterium]